ncbi:M20/M25/M40 family metallo-hydrolase [Flammeovirga sp. EKP202]|uniref:M20/M25/M40 family metallo-hydrolase n=1 Tax=Flammeovirga sp. EKP202 TaxID=2770592 RepID=UPI00165F4ECB|nr:M20/M25/M40 family metallo-hydrolase [Flammeovirga sp. EKP202]MBD0401021.1 M20/M25/M40 family metallo-hydrolase [Flammeovirga sp. EKP202]
MKKLSTYTILSTLLFHLPFAFIYAQSPKEKGLKAIDEGTIASTITYLSSDWMEGREAGRPGAYKSAEYLASMFEFMGLEPAGDVINGKPTYFQAFDVLEYKAAEEQHLSIKNSKGQEFTFTNHTDFEVKAAPTSINGGGNLIFVGYGLQVDSLGYDDFYEKSKLQGKIWVRLKGVPQEGQIANSLKEVPQKQIHKLKEQLADKYGALAIIEIELNGFLPQHANNIPFRDNRKYYEGDRPLSSFYDTRIYSPVTKQSTIPPVFMGGEYIMASLVDRTEVETYEASIGKSKLHKVSLLASSASFQANADVERIRVRNVLAKIEGAKSDSLVMIGAHYDHLGKREGYIWNGADDNASGVAAILGIAKAAKATGVKPNKTLLFAAWTAEEKGLHGSKNFLRTFEDKSKIKMYLNFDMIGRRGDWHSKDNQVSFIYNENSPSTWTLNADNIEKYNINLEMFEGKTKQGQAGGSDNVNFDKEGIPYFWYHTGGHEDYHQVSDHADKIMMDKAAEITKLSFLNIWDMAK